MTNTKTQPTKAKKKQRDQQILNLLTTFKICSRNQIATLIFKDNTNPINVCNRVLRRMVLQNKISQVIRTKDQTYCYTLNPSPIHHKSNKIEHQLKITDYFITLKHRSNFVIEPTFGTYCPDIYYKDEKQRPYCIEIQLTKISSKKMQLKIDQFVSEYAKGHDSTCMIICTNTQYPKLNVPKGFHILYSPIPPEVVL